MNTPPITRRVLLLGSAAFVALATSGLGLPAFAQGNPDAARAFIDGLSQKALEIIKSETSVADKQKRFAPLFKQAFDVVAIGRFVIGRHWQRATPADQKRYMELFGDYVAGIYAQLFSGYSGQSFRTLGARGATEGGASVSSQIERQGPPIRIDFRVEQAGDGYKIVDVTVEGVSLILTKRDEFSSVLNSEGLPGVMSRMESALKQIGAAG